MPWLAINDIGADDGEYIQYLSKYLQKKSKIKMTHAYRGRCFTYQQMFWVIELFRYTQIHVFTPHLLFFEWKHSTRNMMIFTEFYPSLSMVTFVLFLEWASHFCEGLNFLFQPSAQVLCVVGLCWWGKGNATPWNKEGKIFVCIYYQKTKCSWVSLSNVLMDFQWKTIYKV